MSSTHLEHRYTCWNDCQMAGCPGHTATLEYQSVSDALHFNDGKDQELYGQTPEFGALLVMLLKLSHSRVEIKTMFEAAQAEDRS